MPHAKKFRARKNARPFSRPDYNRRSRNLTASALRKKRNRLADFTADREFHPAPKDLLYFVFLYPTTKTRDSKAILRRRKKIFTVRTNPYKFLLRICGANLYKLDAFYGESFKKFVADFVRERSQHEFRAHFEEFCRAVRRSHVAEYL